MKRIPINPKARKAFEEIKNELGREINIPIDKGKLPSRLFSFKDTERKKWI